MAKRQRIQKRRTNWKRTKTTVKNLETGEIWPKLKFGKLKRPRHLGVSENLSLYIDFVCETWLPEDVQKFVYENCYFQLFSNKLCGTTIPPSHIWPELMLDEKDRKRLPPSKPKWIILINKDIPDDRSIYWSIAHEIAHAWADVLFSSHKHERDTDRLVESWGVPNW